MTAGAKKGWRDLASANAMRALGWLPEVGSMVTVARKVSIPCVNSNRYDAPPTWYSPSTPTMRLKPTQAYSVLALRPSLPRREVMVLIRNQERRLDGKRAKPRAAWVTLTTLLPYLADD